MTDWVQAEVIERRDWNGYLFSLCFQASLDTFSAGQFVRVALDIDGERVARPYSLVNAPQESVYEIYFNIVPEGPLSPRLATLSPGDILWVAPKINGFLTLDEVPPARDLWMLATGTAIGPFLSILKTETPWQRFEQIVLGHSVRTQDERAYRDVIDALRQHHDKQFHFVPFITREDCADGLGQRIPACIENGSLEQRVGLTLGPEQAHVLLCGNANMLNDTLACLEKRGMKRHRRREPGHVGMEKYH